MNLKFFLELIPEKFRYKISDFRGRGEYSFFANEYQTIFIHIPKTGGSSVAKSLFDQSSRHVPWFEYYKYNKMKYNKFFKFAFVRNPWDRLVSSYFYLRNGGMNKMDNDWALENIKQYETFQEFVLRWVNKKNINSWIHFKPQNYWICDDKKNIMIDYLGRLETISRDFLFISNKVGSKKFLDKLNKSERGKYQSYYNLETKEIVEKVYHDDVKLFGYSFNDFE